jgi:probable HAF family extracellular repeat protein
MLTLKNLSLTTASSTLIFFATTVPVAAVSFYSITELPFRPSDINDQGQIVGEQYLWNNGTITDFQNLISDNPNNIQLTGINNQGKIVGYWIDYNNGEQAFIADGTNISKLDKPPVSVCLSEFSCSNLIPYDINDAGQIVLVVLRAPTTFRYGASGLFRDADGTFTRLFSGRYVFGMALNNSGQVIGNVVGAGIRNSFFYDNGKTTQLFPTEVTSESNYLVPLTLFSLNDRGQVVGSGTMVYEQQNPFSSPIHGLLWDNPEQNSIGTDLGILKGNYSQANSINNLGQIVGDSGINYGLTSAVIWEEDTIYDLNNLIDNNLGWQLTSALKINDRGQIIGNGYLNSQQRYFLLTPVSKSVPELTSTFSLLGFAAFGIGWQVKRQRNRKKSDHLVS